VQSGEETVLPQSDYDASSALKGQVTDGTLNTEVVTANERIAGLTDWLETTPFPRQFRGNGPAIRKIRRKASSSCKPPLPVRWP